MKKKIVSVELNIFSEKVKQKVLNAGGKDIFPSSTCISTVLEMTQERLRIQQWDVYGYNLADYIHQATRVLTWRSGKGGKVSLYSPFPNWLPTMSNACSCI